MSGSVRLCCATMDNLQDNKGNSLHLNNNSLDAIWNSSQMKETRLKMIKGEKISSCVKCYEQESRGYQSMRSIDNMQQNFSATDTDGFCRTMPTSMELHFGNLCNLKCKMCGQQYSNQIGKELLEIGEKDKEFLDWVYKESGNVNIWTNNLSVEYKWFRNDKIKKRLFDYICKHITHITVIGGEPTVIPEFWELFHYLDLKDALKNISITLTTNLTNTNPKMTSWLPKLKEWNIWASVDGIGERTEYIRYPSNFIKVVDNINFYKSLLKHGNGAITLSPAIQLLNIDQLDDLLKWWLEISGEDFGTKFRISWMAQVWYPIICNYDILPKEYKLKVADKLIQSMPLFVEHKTIKTFYQNQIDNLKNDVCNLGDRKHFQEAFMRYNDTQDKHRKGKTWRQLLPDLESALTASLS